MGYPVDAGAALATLFGYMLSDIRPTYGHLLSSPSTKRTYNQLYQAEFSGGRDIKGSLLEWLLLAVVRLVKQWLSSNGKGKNLVVDPSLRLKS